MRLLPVFIFRLAPFVASLLRKPQALGFRKHPLEKSNRKVDQIGSVFPFQRSIMRAVIAVLPNAFGQIVKVFRNQIILHQPLDPRTKIATLPTCKSGDLLFRQNGLRRQIYSQSEHRSSGIPILHSNTGSSLGKNRSNIRWSMFGRINFGPVREVDKAINFEKVVERTFIFLGSLSFRPFFPLDLLLRNHKDRRSVTSSADSKSLKCMQPFVLNSDDKSRQNIKSNIGCATTWTIGDQFSHISIPCLISRNLPNPPPFVERVAA